MIEFSVTNLVKAFTIGDNILDGLTFHINQGERVGLLGKNGSGKSTLFKILTGELDYDEGEISIAPGHRMGLISQIPVYPEGCTVEAVLETAFQRVRRIEKEMKELEEQMAAGNASGMTSSAPTSNWLEAMIQRCRSIKSATAWASPMPCASSPSPLSPVASRPG